MSDDYELGYVNGESSIEADLATLCDDLGIEVGDEHPFTVIRRHVQRLDSTRVAVSEVLRDFHDDHNWALSAKKRLDLALHQADGCATFRRDCPICVAEVERA